MKKQGFAKSVWELLTREPPRAVTHVDERAYIECREVGAEDREAFESALQAKLQAIPAVQEGELNPILGRVVVWSEGPVDDDALRAAVQEAEQTVTSRRAFYPERTLPGDTQRELQRLVEASADIVGLLSSLGLGILPLIPRGLGSNALGVLFIAQHTPLVRDALVNRLGARRTELLLNLATAGAQAVSQRPLASLVDLSHKVVSLRELKARRELWERIGPDLTAADREAPRAPDFPDHRPRPMAKGPIERHLDRAWWLAAAAGTVSLATTRSTSRAVAALFAALPQPARLGRELFSSELGRILSRRGTLVLSPEALRRMDRVDCLVLPSELMVGEKFSVGEIVGARQSQQLEVERMTRDLFSPEHPLHVQQNGKWILGPLRLLPAVCDAKLQQQADARGKRGALVLGLSESGKVRALIDVRVTAQRGAEEVVQLARKHGMRVVLASDDVTTAEGKHVHDVVPAGEGLVAAIRRLQLDGHTVAYASRRGGAGLEAADLGIALHEPGAPTAWNAHVICADDPEELGLLVQACATAATVSEQSVQLAVGATALGTVVSAGTRSGYASRRVMFVVNAVSLVSMVNALRRTAEVSQKPARWTDPTPWHALDAEGVLARVGAGPEGLPAMDEAAARKRLGGASPTLQLLGAIREELLNPLAPLLAAGAGLSAAVGSMADASMVAGVGGINAIVGGVQRYRTETAIKRLVDQADTRCRVRCEGQVVERRADQLRRGDVVILGPGDLVPADCRVLEAESLEVDASSLTGESLPVLKSTAPSFAETVADRSSMLYAGTTIAAGRAAAIVVALEEDTLARRGLGSVEAPDRPRGGVEQRLADLMAMTGPVAVAAGGALVLAGMLRGQKVDDLVGTGVSLAVAAVPEGLPLLATAAQLSAAQRLSATGTLVRNSRAVEALGRVDVLCLDKTGTITEGRIELDQIHDGKSATGIDALSGDTLDVLRAALCSTAARKGEALDPTDAALVRAGESVGLLRSAMGEFTHIAEQAFESGRGYQAVLGDLDGRSTIFVKGAPEAVLPRCSRYRPAGRDESILDARDALLDAVAGLATKGLRVIAIARGATDTNEDLQSALGQRAALKDTQGLTLLGLLAFRDPVRPTAQAAIDGLARAGVRVVMLTGDHPNTAQAIANEVGLLRGGRVVSGARLAQLSDSDLEAMLEQASVYARVTPAQKVRIVRALQRVGHTVAMVGDGANDAPALRLSDVGIAVGARSTPAARAASDIVIADARIDRLVDAVVEGRAMWISVRDAVSILVGGNLGEIAFSVAIGGLTGKPPLSPRQLLLVNFLTDVAPAMAIALRRPEIEQLEKLAHEGPEASLGAPLNRDILSRAFVTSAGAATAWTVGRLTGTSTRARTIGLAALVGSQLGQTLTAGGMQRPVLLTSLGSAVVLGAIIQTPGLSQMFGCRPLGPFAWSIAMGSAVSATIMGVAMDRTLEWVGERLRDDDDGEPEGPRPPSRVNPVTERPTAFDVATLDPALRRLHN